MMEDQHEKTTKMNVRAVFKTRVATYSNTTIVIVNIIHRPVFI
jgi:hypothetical protein